jgi:hypothetical protein
VTASSGPGISASVTPTGRDALIERAEATITKLVAVHQPYVNTDGRTCDFCDFCDQGQAGTDLSVVVEHDMPCDGLQTATVLADLVAALRAQQAELEACDNARIDAVTERGMADAEVERLRAQPDREQAPTDDECNPAAELDAQLHDGAAEMRRYVTRNFAVLGSGDQMRLIRACGMSTVDLAGLAPHERIREFARIVVAEQRVDQFNAAFQRLAEGGRRTSDKPGGPS